MTINENENIKTSGLAINSAALKLKKEKRFEENVKRKKMTAFKTATFITRERGAYFFPSTYRVRKRPKNISKKSIITSLKTVV
jgi:hypothetical protein